MICAYHHRINNRRDQQRQRLAEVARQHRERHEQRMRDDPAYAERHRLHEEDERAYNILGIAEREYQRARAWSKFTKGRVRRAMNRRAEWTPGHEFAFATWEIARDRAVEAWTAFRARWAHLKEGDAAPRGRAIENDRHLAEEWFTKSIRCHQAFTVFDRVAAPLFRDNIPAHAGGGQIGAFARDRQNVHTQEVVGMMRDAEALTEEAEGDLLPEIFAAFEPQKEHPRHGEVCRDVTQWWGASYVCTPNDWAYQKLVRKIWAKIRVHAEKQELEKRFWEEALDSLGMCATGHLGRLANVLQGYDETAEPPPVAFNPAECLQNAMARIAEMEEVADRLEAARNIFEDLEVPEDERAPWLEALA